MCEEKSRCSRKRRPATGDSPNHHKVLGQKNKSTKKKKNIAHKKKSNTYCCLSLRLLMENNCRPLEHFKLLLDGQWAQNMHKVNPLPHPCCFVESNEKGLKTQRNPKECSHWIPRLWHSKHRGTHDWLHNLGYC